MAKPSTLPKWNANQSGPRTTTPPNGVKDDGVVVGNELPAQWLNWVLSWIYLWILYLNGLTGEALTWTAPQTFQEVIQALKTLDFDTSPGASAYARRITLRCGTAIFVRLFASSDGFVLTVNADWDQTNTQWAADSAGVRAFRLDAFNSIGFKLKSHGPAATWADNGWTTTLYLNTGGDLVVANGMVGQTATVQQSAASNTGGSSVGQGIIFAESPPIARALIEGNGAANPTLLYGMNISAITRDGATGRYKVILLSGATNYVLPKFTPMCDTATVAQIYKATPPTLDTFRFTTWDAATGNAVDLAAGERMVIEVGAF